MIRYVNEVSHRWRRATTLRGLAAGHVRKEAVCDADFLLVTASKVHGFDGPYPCPVCGADPVRHVRWVYSHKLGQRSGTARAEHEIEAIVKELSLSTRPPSASPHVTVHLVEVCPQCRWNHLLSAAEAVVD